MPTRTRLRRPSPTSDVQPQTTLEPPVTSALPIQGAASSHQVPGGEQPTHQELPEGYGHHLAEISVLPPGVGSSTAGGPVTVQSSLPDMSAGSEQLPMQRQEDLGVQIRSRLGGGSPLPQMARRQLEGGLGANLGAVRVHTDGEADRLARSVQAVAFTTGSDIFFRQGAYNPDTPHGLHLLAHEATHTIQQSRGPVEGTPHPGGVSISNPGDRFERAAVDAAVRVALSNVPVQRHPAGRNEQRVPGPETSLVIQRNGGVGLGQVADEDLEAVGEMFAEAEAALRMATFHQFEPALAQYAKRAEGFQQTGRFKGDLSPMLAALTLPRGPNGELTQAAIDAFNQNESVNIANLLQKSASSRLKILLPIGRKARKQFLKQLRQAMAQHTNPVTGDTEFPELRNVTEDGIAPNYPVTVVANLEGVNVTVTHDLNDANIGARLKSVQEAMQLIRATGIVIPAMRLNLPRYGRMLTVSPTCQLTATDATERAIFVPPNFLHVSSENQNNPLADRVPNVLTGAQEFKFSSTGFDPSGVGTIVHEFGHFLHYQNSPRKFHGLALSSFKAAGNVQTAAAEVSQYGTKPREFVAEVFLGLVYGKHYSDDVMEMYKAFGGMMPPSLAATYAHVPG